MEGIYLVWMQFDAAQKRYGKEILKFAAQDGDADALCFYARTLMGTCYVGEYEGFDTSDDNVDLLAKAIEMGSSSACMIAMRIGFGFNNIKNLMPFASLKEVFNDVMEKAEAGNPMAQMLIGNAYYFWDIFEIDDVNPFEEHDEEWVKNYTHSNAALWLDRSLKGGLTFGAHNLRNIYQEDGMTEERDAVMDRCVKLGDPEWLAEKARELSREGDQEKALELFQKGADMGEGNCLFGLAKAYDYGKAVEVDDERAVSLYKQAARAGDFDARVALAIKTFFGQGIPEDYETAKWAIDSARKQADEDLDTDYARKEIYGLYAHAYLNHYEASEEEMNIAGNCLLWVMDHLWDENISWWDMDQKRACYDIGHVFRAGLFGATIDLEASYNYYKKAADMGYPKAGDELCKFSKGFLGMGKLRYNG